MHKLIIHTPKPDTTLPAHETAARRTRARILEFRVKPRPEPPPALPADLRTNPQLFGNHL